GRHGQRLRDRAVARAELPLSVAPDGDGDDVVALGIERLEHGPGRGERDVVFGRAPAGEHRDPQPIRHYGGPEDGFVVVENLPTAIVTVEPGGAFVPPAGSCVCTMPSWLESVTGCETMLTLKPEAFSCATASPCAMLVTSGTVDVVGPFETLRMIV